jgi:hypothetical protein
MAANSDAQSFWIRVTRTRGGRGLRGALVVGAWVTTAATLGGVTGAVVAGAGGDAVTGA